MRHETQGVLLLDRFAWLVVFPSAVKVAVHEQSGWAWAFRGCS